MPTLPSSAGQICYASLIRGRGTLSCTCFCFKQIWYVCATSISDLLICPSMQLALRRQGNETYRQGHLQPALESYSQAKAVVDLISGQSSMEQHEININQCSVCLNLAAVHLGLGNCLQAVHYCTEALTAVPHHVKAYVRRAKAHLQLHNYQVHPPAMQELYPTHSNQISIAHCTQSYSHGRCIAP